MAKGHSVRRTSTPRVWLVRFVCLIAHVAILNGSAAASQFGFVYALQQVSGGTNQIYGFRFDPTTGALTLLPGFPIGSGGTGATGQSSEHLAHADGRLYVVNDGSNTLTAFSVNRSTGALTAMPFNPVALGTGAWGCVAVHPGGSPVVVGNGSGGLSSFVVTSTTATPAAGSPYTTGNTSFSCRFSQSGEYVYTGGNTGTTIAGFSVTVGTGVLTALAGSPFDTGAPNPLGYATAMDGSRRLFSVMGSASQVRAFTTALGVPTAVAGNPFASGLTTGTHGVMHPGGFYMVADRAGNRIGSYQIAGIDVATTLTPVAGSPFATGGSFTQAVAVTPDGTHLLAANGASRNLTVFQVNQSTGVLSLIGLQPVNALGASGNVSGLAFAQSEAGFVYSLTQVNGGANLIYGFRISPSTGALTALPGFPVATGGTGTFASAAEHMAYHNGRLYVLNDGSDTMSPFKVNRTTGALTALPFSPVAVSSGTQACVAVHPSGSPVVVGDGSLGLHSVNVGATTATLAPGSPFGPAASFSCRFSQDGNYVYTGGNFGSAFAGFSVNSSTGVLTPLAGSPYGAAGTAPASYATDSAGRLFLASLNSTSEVRAFTTAAGIPTPVSGNPFPADDLNQPVHGILHPAGFYMVAARNSSDVGVFRIAGAGAATTLTQVPLSPYSAGGGSTTALALTPDSVYLVAGNGTSRSLTVFQVNPTTGDLIVVGVQTSNTLGATGRVTGLALAAAIPPFIDDPLTGLPPLSRVIKTIHVTELRQRIDGVRAQYGLGPYAYTDPTLNAAATVIQAAHISDLRAALAQAYTAAGIAPPAYTDPVLTSGTIVVKAVHITELRSAVMAIE